MEDQETIALSAEMVHTTIPLMTTTKVTNSFMVDPVRMKSGEEIKNNTSTLPVAPETIGSGLETTLEANTTGKLTVKPHLLSAETEASMAEKSTTVTVDPSMVTM